MSQGGVLAFLFGFAAFMGALMSAYATVLFDPMIVAKIFFMTVAMFGALSLFGYTTGFNLSSIIKYAAAAFMAYVAIAVVGMGQDECLWCGVAPAGFHQHVPDPDEPVRSRLIPIRTSKISARPSQERRAFLCVLPSGSAGLIGYP